MRYEIEGKYQRRCTVTERTVYCPNASLLGYSVRQATPGSAIVYRETYVTGDSGTRHGRVLGRVDALPQYDPKGVNHAPEVKGFLYVLAISDDGRFAYIRWVDPAHVISCYAKPATMFARFFYQEKLPNPQVVSQLADYGTLSEHYIGDPKCGPEVLRGKDGRAELYGWAVER